MGRSSSSSFVQTITSVSDQKVSGGEGSTNIGAGAVVTNPNPERVLAPAVSLLETITRESADYNREVLKAQTRRDEAQTGLAASALQGLAEQRARETGAIESLLEKWAPWLIGGLVVVAIFAGRRRT